MKNLLLASCCYISDFWCLVYSTQIETAKFLLRLVPHHKVLNGQTVSGGPLLPVFA